MADVISRKIVGGGYSCGIYRAELAGNDKLTKVDRLQTWCLSSKSLVVNSNGELTNSMIDTL